MIWVLLRSRGMVPTFPGLWHPFHCSKQRTWDHECSCHTCSPWCLQDADPHWVEVFPTLPSLCYLLYQGSISIYYRRNWLLPRTLTCLWQRFWPFWSARLKEWRNYWCKGSGFQVEARLFHYWKRSVRCKSCQLLSIQSCWSSGLSTASLARKLRTKCAWTFQTLAILRTS